MLIISRMTPHGKTPVVTIADFRRLLAELSERDELSRGDLTTLVNFALRLLKDRRAA